MAKKYTKSSKNKKSNRSRSRKARGNFFPKPEQDREEIKRRLQRVTSYENGNPHIPGPIKKFYSLPVNLSSDSTNSKKSSNEWGEHKILKEPSSELPQDLVEGLDFQAFAEEEEENIKKRKKQEALKAAAIKAALNPKTRFEELRAKKTKDEATKVMFNLNDEYGFGITKRRKSKTKSKIKHRKHKNYTKKH